MKNQNTVYKVNRRKFLKSGALSTAGLMLGVNVSFASKTGHMTDETKAIFSPSVYLSIDSSGEVTITAHRSEMGNAIRTTLPLIVADELEAEWDKVKIVQAEGDRKYGNQNTDGSFSVRMFYMPMRRVGATARYLLEQAAAKTWNVPVHECKALKHKVYHTTGKSLDFGKLAATAAKLPVPKAEEVKLKDKKDFKYITKKTSIYDLKDIVEGKAKYGHDVEVPNARVAVIKRPPVPGGKVKTFDSSAALKVKGVEKVFKIDSPPAPTGFNPLGGIVVVAKNTWAALKGREALKVTWDLGKNGDYNTDEFKKYLQKTTQNDKGLVRREGGNVATGLKDANQTLKLDYFIPHYTHSPNAVSLTSLRVPCRVVEVSS